MTLTDYGRSVIRTVVPLVVGSVIGWLATRGVDVDASTIIPAVDAIIAGGYYALIRAAEKRWPSAGLMLGARGAPSYAAPPAAPNGFPAP
jgi:hypothetical protein